MRSEVFLARVKAVGPKRVMRVSLKEGVGGVGDEVGGVGDEVGGVGDEVGGVGDEVGV